jgi:hypothetical protein
VRREWFPDEGDREVEALSTCLGLAPDDLRRPLFLDTETTGLSGGTGTVAFLVGLAWREAGGLRLAQYFLRDFNEENALLWAVGQCVSEAGVLVSAALRPPGSRPPHFPAAPAGLRAANH